MPGQKNNELRSLSMFSGHYQDKTNNLLPLGVTESAVVSFGYMRLLKITWQ